MTGWSWTKCIMFDQPLIKDEFQFVFKEVVNLQGKNFTLRGMSLRVICGGFMEYLKESNFCKC